ncbi:MAG: MATE family efflux transporter [Oscillospiraceae bacterium]|nr:MATE family efflux transporter [Oscillospiraceae bacterium]
MANQLSQHFTYSKLIKFVISSVIMMIFTSIYGVVDGLFVSNYVGKTPFAGLNLIMPLLMILSSLGFMIGTGGSAIVSKTLGEGESKKANEYFSMLVYVTLIIGIVLTISGEIFLRPIALLMGADENLIEYCVLYGRILLLSLPAFMLQNLFQSFLVTAEKPQIGLAVIVIAGITNIIGDFLFIAVFRWGLAGAGIATALSQVMGGFIPFIYFSRKNTSLLRFTKTRFNGKILFKTCTNGSSELMTNISISLVSMIYNFQLMSVAGEDGVSAYGVIMYVNFVFVAIFIGFSIGTAPLIGYNYGSGNHKELQNLFKKSLVIVSITALFLFTISQILSSPLTKIFVGYDESLFNMTSHGFKIYAISFLINGFNIAGSSFFTALGNGLISALISFLRTLVFQVSALIILPIFFGINGIWASIAVAEFLAVIVTVIFFVKNKEKYHYL